MDATLLFLIIFGIALLFTASHKVRSHFTGDDAYPSLGTLLKSNDPCSGHCLEENGKVMDVYDCCNCQAITNGGEWTPYFRKCMCKQGWGNYCFREETNYLLSQ